jgi:hypothetical protein
MRESDMNDTPSSARAALPSISLIVSALLALVLSTGVRASESLAQNVLASPHAKKHAAAVSHSQRVEARISELRSKLNISQEQEPKWTELTQIMRANAQNLDKLTQARRQSTDMTAVEDLQSYSEIADAHAEGLRRFVPVFTALYESMSEPQKKQADALFDGRTRQAAKAGAKAHS